MDPQYLFEWLHDDGLYSGKCKLLLADPQGSISGNATLRVARSSRCEAEVSIEEFYAPPAYGGNLLAFLNASPPKQQDGKTVVTVGANADERFIVSLEVETGFGVWSASSGLLLTPVLWGFGTKETLSVVLNDLAFSASTNKAAKYWLIPLRGPFENHYLKRPVSLNHLLALDSASYVSFLADGRACGLQIFEREKKPVHPLVTYDALAFGELQGTPRTLEETWNALPSGLIEALSFAVGADVTAPWIELRADDGSLVQRFFCSLGHRSSPEGFAAFSMVNEFRPHSGIGAFLNAFFVQPTERRHDLIAPFNLIRSGSPGSFNIEDSITDLVKALDNLCKQHGFSTQELLGRLEPENQQKVKDILAETRGNLKQIMAENENSGRHAQGKVLKDISERLNGVASTSRNFGVAVRDLLRHFGLHDADVLDLHYSSVTSQQITWADILSVVRGEVIHKGFLRVTDRSALRRWFRFACHLHDLCKRLVLREVDYGGVYQASTNPWQGDYAVDRVTATMTAKDLGFSEVPVRL